MFSDIFIKLLQNKNISAYKLSKDTGISQALISQWKNNKQTPSPDNLLKIADYFNVSINYLLEKENLLETEELNTSDILDKEDVHITIGQRIFHLLETQDKKQSELSEFTGIPTTTINSWKTRNTNPSSDKIMRISEFFDVSPIWLLTGQEVEESNLKTQESSTDERLLLNAYRIADEGNKMLILQKAIELSKQVNSKAETVPVRLIAKEGGSIQSKISKEDAEKFNELDKKITEERLLKKLRH